jgi:hypothetical protein
MTDTLPDAAKAALDRLIGIAQRDTGQSRNVANFLLAWWNASECGGFDLTELWGVDAAIAAEVLAVFAILPAFRYYPDARLVTAPSSKPLCASGGQRPPGGPVGATGLSSK